MNTDDFEERLRRLSMRPIPRQWRGEILDAARRASSQPPILSPQPTAWWREWLWPCPQAWAGLAAAWVLILALNAAMRDPVQVVKTSKAAPAPELLTALREHRRLLTELIGAPTVVGTSKPFEPRPRSDLSHQTAAV